jgi:hypothetical protein
MDDAIVVTTSVVAPAMFSLRTNLPESTRVSMDNPSKASTMD